MFRIDPAENPWHVHGQRIDQSGEFAVEQNRANLLPHSDFGELRLGETGVQHGQAQPGLARRHHRQHQATMVTRQHADHLAATQALPEQTVRQGVGLLIELAIGQHPALVGQRGFVGPIGRPGADHRRLGAVGVVERDHALDPARSP